MSSDLKYLVACRKQTSRNSITKHHNDIGDISSLTTVQKANLSAKIKDFREQLSVLNGKISTFKKVSQ